MLPKPFSKSQITDKDFTFHRYTSRVGFFHFKSKLTLFLLLSVVLHTGWLAVACLTQWLVWSWRWWWWWGWGGGLPLCPFTPLYSPSSFCFHAGCCSGLFHHPPETDQDGAAGGHGVLSRRVLRGGRGVGAFISPPLPHLNLTIAIIRLNQLRYVYRVYLVCVNDWLVKFSVLYHFKGTIC